MPKDKISRHNPHGYDIETRNRLLDTPVKDLKTPENRDKFIQLLEHYGYITHACQECYFNAQYVCSWYSKVEGFRDRVKAACKDSETNFVEHGYDNVRAGVLEGLDFVLSQPVETRDHDLFFKYSEVFNRMVYFKEMVKAQKQMTEDAPPLSLDLSRLSKEQRDALLPLEKAPEEVGQHAYNRKRINLMRERQDAGYREKAERQVAEEIGLDA